PRGAPGTHRRAGSRRPRARRRRRRAQPRPPPRRAGRTRRICAARERRADALPAEPARAGTVARREEDGPGGRRRGVYRARADRSTLSPLEEWHGLEAKASRLARLRAPRRARVRRERRLGERERERA